MNIKAAMERFSFKYNGDVVLISQSKGQPELYSIDVNNRFQGYITINNGVIQAETNGLDSLLLTAIKEALCDGSE